VLPADPCNVAVILVPNPPQVKSLCYVHSCQNPLPLQEIHKPLSGRFHIFSHVTCTTLIAVAITSFSIQCCCAYPHHRRSDAAVPYMTEESSRCTTSLLRSGTISPMPSMKCAPILKSKGYKFHELAHKAARISPLGCLLEPDHSRSDPPLHAFPFETHTTCGLIGIASPAVFL
jgi:hypothetical protein